LVFLVVIIDGYRAAESALFTWKMATSKVGQCVKRKAPPTSLSIYVNHGLAKFVFLVYVFNIVSLIDGVHQVTRFSDPPKYFVYTDGDIPLASIVGPEQLTDVAVTPFRVFLIAAYDAYKTNLLTSVLAPPTYFRLNEYRVFQAIILLDVKGGLPKVPGFQTDTPRVAKLICSGEAGHNGSCA
jgi:hypothetical protein